MSTEPSPQDALAWERERRPWAGGAAVAAAVLILGGNVLISLALRDLPKAEGRVVTVVDALRDVAAGRAVPPGRLSAQVEYLGHHTAGPVAGAVLVALGTLAAFLPLAYLYRATRARNPALGQWILVLLAVGSVLYGVGNLTVSLTRYLGAHDFLTAADRSNSGAQDALTQPPYAAGTALTFAGSVAFLFGLAVTSLNAMRVGLLTRFMGIMGMIVAATFLLPLDQLGIIRSLWLGALAALLLGRWPSGVPAAWSSGEAAPWPSQQQAREARTRARDGDAPVEELGAPASASSAGARTPGSPSPAPTPPAPGRPAPRAEEAHASSKKKRRKRR